MSVLVFAGRLALLLAGLVFCSCSPKLRSAGGGTIHNSDAPFSPGEQVQLVQEAGRPTLQLVRRAGDPLGAVAFAVFPPGGSAATLLLAGLLEERLGLSSYSKTSVHIQVHSLGLVVSREVETPKTGGEWMTHVSDALLQPVSAEEAKKLVGHAFLETAATRVHAPSPYRDCMGQLGAEGGEALQIAKEKFSPKNAHAHLERLRASASVASRVGFSALGEAALLKQVAQAHDRRWPAGDRLDDSWINEKQVAIIESAGGRELRVALRIADSEAALSGARALLQSDHPLHAQLYALDSDLRVSDVEVSLRPAGACVGLSLHLKRDASPPKLSRIAEAALVATDEMRATLRSTIGSNETTLALLSPQGALEASALAAWTAVRSSRTGARLKEVVEYRSPPAEKLSAAQLATTLEETRQEWSKRKIPTVTRKEVGQAELWMILGSRCGLFAEPALESGLRALTLRSLAENFQGDHGVSLQPWISPSGIGLVAHSPPLRGERPTHHARRIARALAQAIAGRQLDGRAVAKMRNSQIESVGSDPGVDLITSVLGGEHTSLLRPWGNEKALASASTADVERARADLANEPLRLAVLENSESTEPGTNQSLAAQQALSEWLAPLRSQVTKCTRPSFVVAQPGLWTLETIDDKVQEAAYVGVWAPASASLGRATEFLLNRPGGYLDSALDVPQLVAQARSEWLGGVDHGGLVIHVAAEEEHLTSATAQVRGLLQKLSEGAVTEKNLQAAAAFMERQQARIQRLPGARLVELWKEGQAPPAKGQSETRKLTAANLQSFHAKLAGAQHRIVVVERRK